MIYIVESEKIALSGVNSLFITSKFNVNVNNIIKSCETYHYHDSSHAWEVPVNQLAYLLDNLVYIDDIDLIVEDNVENKTPRTRKLTYKTSPYPYQLQGIEYFLNHDKGLLLDAPGLGKTLQMIYLAEELKAQEHIEHCLIICGIASLRTNWEKEIRKHSNESCVIIGARINKNGRLVWNTVQKRAEQLRNKLDEFFVIINVEGLIDDRIVDAINNGENKFGLIVLDEAHKCKGSGSIRGLNLLEIQAPHQVAMTGTLLLNKPVDAYMPLAWIGVEKKSKKKGTSGITKFENTYCVYSEPIVVNKKKPNKKKSILIGYKNLDVFKDEIESCSLRRTKELLDLPPKNFIDEVLVMEPDQEKFYETIKNSVEEEFKELAKDLCDKVTLSANNLLSLSTRLRQASSCPSVLTTDNISSCKINRAIDLVEEIVSNGNKVVIMSTFKEPVYILQKELAGYKPLIGTGDIKEDEISSNIDLFQQDDEHKVFIGTISKMGTGFTLTRASYMIFIDLPWTAGLYEQTCDRIHRIGAKSPVFIYNLICKDTIDEATYQAIQVKQALSDFVIDDNQSDSVMQIIQKYLQDLK